MYDLKRLIDYSSWANGIWIRFLSNHETDESVLLNRMSHIMLSEQVWLQRIKGEEPFREIWLTLPAAQLSELHTEHQTRFHQLLGGDLKQIVTYRRFSGEEYRSPVEDILMHLVLHGAHHRGQMAMNASSSGLNPANTDFIRFCRLHGF